MNDLLKARNLLADYINHLVINEKISPDEENNQRLYQVLDILNDEIKAIVDWENIM